MSLCVEEIGEWTFGFCDALENIHIPESVTIIGSQAFAECSSLSEISIPGSVQILGDHAFENCDSLERLFVDEGRGTHWPWCVCPLSILSSRVVLD